VAHWTDVLSNISLAVFVLLAVSTAAQWGRHRISGSGWLASAFVIVAAVALALEIRPSLVDDRITTKSLVSVILVALYCLFRFATTQVRASHPVDVVAAVVTLAVIGFTCALGDLPVAGALGDLPVAGAPRPAHLAAYQATFIAVAVLLLGETARRLLGAASRAPVVAAWRMGLTAGAGSALLLPVVVGVLQRQDATLVLATRAVTVAAGLVFLVALVVPSVLRIAVGARADRVVQRTAAELVSASDEEAVAASLLPRLRQLVGASEVTLAGVDGFLVARDPLSPAPEGLGAAWGLEGVSEGDAGTLTVRTTSGSSHVVVARVDPSVAYFGTAELRQLDHLAELAGRAIQRCEAAEHIAFRASHDGLTGLANRGLFLDRLEEALRHVGRRRSSLAVLFIDLDHFKQVNDRADHSTGDAVLNEMADRMTTMTRGVDVVARFGGDEFVALAEVDNEDDARDMAERIRRGLGAPLRATGVRFAVTASIGVVVTADPSLSPARVLRGADDAMYEAKRAGRNCVVLHGGVVPAAAPRANADAGRRRMADLSAG
jgi:diguanylate cyclase (GGDEF)-like protein